LTNYNVDSNIGRDSLRIVKIGQSAAKPRIAERSTTSRKAYLQAKGSGGRGGKPL